MPDRDSRSGESAGVADQLPTAVIASAHRIGEQVGRVSALAASRLGELAVSSLARFTADVGDGSSSSTAGDVPMGRQVSSPALDRAEAIVSRVGQRAAQLTGGLQERLMRSVAVAREEAEDILVDAQELRGRGHDVAPPTP